MFLFAQLDHELDEPLMLEDETTTTVRPTPGFMLTTTLSPATTSSECVHNGSVIADGALVDTGVACDHCYCMRGDIVCVVMECGTAMENEGKNCTAVPPAPGKCCPDNYICDGTLVPAEDESQQATLAPRLDATTEAAEPTKSDEVDKGQGTLRPDEEIVTPRAEETLTTAAAPSDLDRKEQEPLTTVAPTKTEDAQPEGKKRNFLKRRRRRT